MSHIVDSDRQLLINAGDEAAKRHDNLVQTVAEVAATRRFLRENEMHNFQAQAGRTMSADDFEKRVKKLVPSIKFSSYKPEEWQCNLTNIPVGSTIRLMEHVNPDGSVRTIARYVYTATLPEYSVIMLRKVRVPTTFKDVSARDFPKAVKVGEETYWDPTNGGGWRTDPVYKFEEDTPLDQYDEEPCGSIPGWRSALLLLIWEKLTTLDAVEREFGASDKAAWAAKTGKQLINSQV